MNFSLSLDHADGTRFQFENKKKFVGNQNLFKNSQ